MWDMKIFFGALFIIVAGLSSVAILPTREAEPPALAHVFPEASRRATLVFVGDMMFDRFIRSSIEANGADYILRDIDEVLQEADLAVGNLEGPITGNESVSRGTKVGDLSNMRFTFDEAVPGILASAGIDFVSLGNNHILDFGYEGARETKARLISAGIGYVGDPEEWTPSIALRELSGLRFTFVPYSDFYGPRAPETLKAIAIAKEASDVVVVLAHWGEEYLPEPPERVRELGRSFVDAGASLVIGSHPHVVQPHEDYRGARIYYSLGNFVFDQYFDEKVRCGLMVRATYIKSAQAIVATFEEVPVGMQRDGSTALGCS